jgi:5-methylcytosine-specific restriction endonuclease McrA
MKTCARCKTEKHIDQFGKDKNRKDGLNKYCKKCVSDRYLEDKVANNARSKSYYLANRERLNAINRDNYYKHIEEAREYKRKYYHAHRAEIIKYNTDWIKNNKDKYKRYAKKNRATHLSLRAEHEQRRRARKRNATVEKVNRDDIIKRDKSTCQICGKLLSKKEITLDHIIPLSRGGEHSKSNLQVACNSCNCKKSSKI